MHNRKLRFIFGPEVCQKVALFFEKNVSAIAANTSLGFLLGMVPGIMAFLGLGLDVRHVTLSSGSLAAAIPVYGFEIFKMEAFWLAVAGIPVIAFFNVTVSFFLALFTAIKSRNIKSIQRGHIYRAVWQRFKGRPLSFIYPKE